MGEHVLFVQELITELIDPSLGIIVLTERFQFDNDDNEIRFRGQVSEVNFGTLDEVELKIEILGEMFQTGLLPPTDGEGVGVSAGASPGAVFDFHNKR